MSSDPNPIVVVMHGRVGTPAVASVVLVHIALVKDRTRYR